MSKKDIIALSMLLANTINATTNETVNYAELTEAYSIAIKDMKRA